jgi:hypothetical protein
MVSYSTVIKKFDQQGEKTGWTYIEVPIDLAEKLKPGNKKSFRIKGKLDEYTISGVALLPMGGGRFIMPLNAAMRKGTHKKKGAMIQVQIEVDKATLQASPEFLECLTDEPKAKAFFEQLSTAHRNYYIKWLGGVKTEAAVTKRITQAIYALSKELDFIGMHYYLKAEREKMDRI